MLDDSNNQTTQNVWNDKSTTTKLALVYVHTSIWAKEMKKLYTIKHTIGRHFNVKYFTL